MKGLTLTQPWASLVAVGAKRFETRSWRTHYRGPLAIHAAVSMPRMAAELLTDRWIATLLITKGVLPDQLARGGIVAVCRLVGCRPTMEVAPEVGTQETRLGDWRSGRWAWELADVIPLASPIPHRGSLGLWNVDADVAGRLPAWTIDGAVESPRRRGGTR